MPSRQLHSTAPGLALNPVPVPEAIEVAAPYPVRVPKYQPRDIEYEVGVAERIAKPFDVPVAKIIDTNVPYDVPVAAPYQVEIENKVAIDVPYDVEVRAEVPVHVPYDVVNKVEVEVPMAYEVRVEHPYEIAERVTEVTREVPSFETRTIQVPSVTEEVVMETVEYIRPLPAVVTDVEVEQGVGATVVGEHLHGGTTLHGASRTISGGAALTSLGGVSGMARTRGGSRVGSMGSAVGATRVGTSTVGGLTVGGAHLGGLQSRTVRQSMASSNRNMHGFQSNRMGAIGSN